MEIVKEKVGFYSGKAQPFDLDNTGVSREKDFKIQEKPIKWLPVDHVMNVIHAMPDYHQPIFVWCYLHMRRPSEAMALYKSDFVDGVFYIQRDFVMSKLVDYTKTDKVYTA